MLRVRTGPVCPEDNLRVLPRDSNTNCGIVRERGKKRERENLPVKSSKAQPGSSQNRGLSEHQRRASGCGPAQPSLKTSRWATARAGRKGEIFAIAKHLVACVARTWEGHKTQAQPSLRLCGVPKNLNLSILDLGSAGEPRAHLRQFLAEQPRA